MGTADRGDWLDVPDTTSEQIFYVTGARWHFWALLIWTVSLAVVL